MMEHEVYTRVGENLPPRRKPSPEKSECWTIHFIERPSRYWVDVQAGLKDASLFEMGVKSAWDCSKPSDSIRWFIDGEQRYGKELWKLASVYLGKSAILRQGRYLFLP